ncbi:GNAT family N-acetyltransferase [Neisseria sp. MVDL20-010259]|uniref:GNAT family N-acetyltransferase n=1 Tax=Neisseria sp. MVDL20-010259 TaxID=3061170 RepID=UPI0026602779|nr:GNAT family N-acetyltransferase [Neisseria sp. MVDL20-010259]MDO1564120.1 GNAT family N-acetyltransferase [Neisseria sp. MVDL20-010259]
MTISIRPLHEEHAEAWRALWQAYLAFYQTELSADVSDHTWRQIVHNENIKGLAAFDNQGRMLGFAHIVLHPNTWNTTDCCYLEDLFVDSRYRWLGVARSLIEAVYRLAEQHNCNRVYWVTAQDNHAAQALYHQVARQTGMVQYRKDFQ